MAKRKRLSPVDPDRIRAKGGLETKGAFLDAPAGKVPDRALGRRPAPIADVAAETASTAALNEMADNWSQVRRDGRLVVELPLERIRLDHIERDRLTQDPEETEALMESLRRRGQQTPIEVVELPGEEGYGLLSGWRRCRALKALLAETGEDRFGRVLALLRRPEDAPAAYLTMVEENEIRANLSHYERARIVVKAVEYGVFADEREGLSELFASASRARRSKIGSFLALVQGLDGVLRFPAALSERVGLALAQALKESPGFVETLGAALEAAEPQDAAEEQAVIAAELARLDAAQKEAPAPRPEPEMLARLPGLEVAAGADGRVVLSGKALDPSLCADLVTWLEARLRG